MSELEKQSRGEEFWNQDPQIVEAKRRARRLSYELNRASIDDEDTFHRIVEELFAGCGENLYLKPPFYCDYGYNIHIGNNVLINYQCVFLDAAPITIGDNCFIGPMCGLYTVRHPLDVQRRNEGYVTGRPIILKDNVWLGGSCTILPGVTIGENSVIGAGSVVTKDIPDNVIAVGDPARVIRQLDQTAGGQKS